jgi:bacterial surface protein 26-residue repeat protein (3 repeats) (fragment)
MTTTPEAYVHLSEDQMTLTFYYDTLRAERDGTTWGIRDKKDWYFPAWTANLASPNTTVLTVVFDASFRDFRPTTTAGWFAYLRSLKSIEGFEYLNTSQVTKMGVMFVGCESLTALDLSNFDTAKVTDMNGMFYFCESLTALDLSSFNTAQVTKMNGMFGCCESLTALDLSNFDTSKVTDMKGMFEGCRSLRTLDLSSFDTSEVRNMRGMFAGCKSLTDLDLSNFKTS